MYDDTALMRMLIDRLSERFGWSYEEAMERFYSSDICGKLSDQRTGLFTCAPIELVELFEEEGGVRKLS